MIRASGAVRGTMRVRRIARAGHRAAILRPLRSVSMVTLPLRCAVRAPDSGLQQKHGVLIIHPSIRRLREMIVSYFNLEDRNHNPHNIKTRFRIWGVEIEKRGFNDAHGRFGIKFGEACGC